MEPGGREPMKTFAIVDDDKSTNDGYRSWLEKEYPDSQIDQFFNFQDAKENLASKPYDLVLLDIELGTTVHERVGGFPLAKILDEREIPVVIVSGTPQDMLYKPIIKQLYAWDYLQKPVEQVELLTTVGQVLLETSQERAAEVPEAERQGATADPRLHIAPFGRHSVTWNGERVALSVTQMKILELLVREHDQVIPYERLAALCKSSRARENLRVHIKHIRDNIEAVDPDFTGLDTVPMKGYIWRVGHSH
jgi:DNA-binding response OmpR family regulator